MTVLVGMRVPTTGEIVLAADRLALQGNFRIIDELYDFDRWGNREELALLVEFHCAQQKVLGHTSRKFELHDHPPAVLAHCGTQNETSNVVTDLLLRPKTFLANDAALKEMLFPFPVSDETAERELAAYRKSFSLEERFRKMYIPEIRRLHDIVMVGKTRYPFDLPGGLPIWFYDRKFNHSVSEYLFATRMEFSGGQHSALIDISATGALEFSELSTKGSGGDAAKKYLWELFDIKYNFEARAPKNYSLDQTIEAATNAVKYANEHSLFCKGVEYVVLHNDGITTHWSDESMETSFSADDLYNIQMQLLSERQEFLARFRHILDNPSPQAVAARRLLNEKESD